jgi:hypothetical protein
MSPPCLKPDRLERFLTSVCAASRSLYHPDIPSYLDLPARNPCSSHGRNTERYKYPGSASKLPDTARLVPAIINYAAVGRSRKTAYAGDANAPVAAIDPGRRARSTSADILSHVERTSRAFKRLAMGPKCMCVYE